MVDINSDVFYNWSPMLLTARK